MQYLNMLSYQVRQAIKENVPVLLPLGVIEYHAEHLPLGTDCFVCQEVIRRVEEKHPEIVVLPPFYYGSASYAVAAPEGNGSVQVESNNLIPVAKNIFKSLLRVGFRNIYAFIAHQTEEFYQGMPTDLAFRTAARQTIFEWLEQESGEGWWGNEKFSNYYSGNNNPFAWIQIHPCLVEQKYKDKFAFDHAGKCETSCIMVTHPDCVEMDRLDQNIWYARTSVNASPEYGDAVLSAQAEYVENIIFPDKA